jgi:hypothetical protein
MTSDDVISLHSKLDTIHSDIKECAKENAVNTSNVSRHEELISGLYDDRNNHSSRLNTIETTYDLEQKHDGEDRRSSNHTFDRVTRILTITAIVVFGILTVLSRIGIL